MTSWFQGTEVSGNHLFRIQENHVTSDPCTVSLLGRNREFKWQQVGVNLSRDVETDGDV